MDLKKAKEIAAQRRSEAQESMKEREAQRTREQQRQERRQERLVPFLAVAKQNRNLARRAHWLAALRPSDGVSESDEVTHGPTIVLGTFSCAPGDESDQIIGRVASFKNKKEGTSFVSLRVSVNNNDSDTISREYSYEIGVDLDSEMSSETYKSDEIYKIGNQGIGGDRFMLIEGRWINRTLGSIHERLASLEETLTMFERAARDPQLNPELAPLLPQVDNF